MRFAWPIAFVLLLLIPIVGALWLRPRRSGAVRFSSVGAVESLGPTLRQRSRHALLLLRLACIAFLVAAIARPQKGISETRVATEGAAIEMVLDRSGSMDEEMIFDGRRMTRFDAARRVFSEFVLGNGADLPGRPNDLIGLVAFAGFAETVCPLVRSREAIVTLAERMHTAQHRLENGTAIGDAIALAAARLHKAEEDIAAAEAAKGRADFRIKSKIIIMLTDGRNNAGDVHPVRAAEMARDWGIKIYTIGVGSGAGAGGARARIFGDGVDDRMLTDIAQITDGMYFPAPDAESLRRVYREIDRLEKTLVEATEYTEYEEAFPPLAVAAGVALLLEIFLGATLFRRIP